MDKAKTIVSGMKVHRPVIDEQVTAEDWKVAREELNETMETRSALLKALTELLENENDFMARVDEIYLLRFLRSRKFDLEKSYNLIRDHYLYRAQNPKVFPSPSSMENALYANIFNYLPHRDHKGRAIFVVKLGNWDPDVVSFKEFVAVGNILSEYVLDNHVTQINGYIGIWDFKGFTLKQCVPFCLPKNVFLLQCLMQHRFPGRFKIAYCVNTHHLFGTAWKVIKAILTDKFKKRIKILGTDMKVLHQFIDPCILPNEYGGVMPPWDCTDIVRRILDKEQYFNYNRKFGFHKI